MQNDPIFTWDQMRLIGDIVLAGRSIPLWILGRTLGQALDCWEVEETVLLEVEEANG
jgi:hypothetical protein